MSRLVTYQPDQIPGIWPYVKHHVARALDRGSIYTLQDIYERLCEGKFQLWTSQSEHCEAALITAIQEKDCKFCLLLAAGGRNMRVWVQWLPHVEEWAREHGCKELRIYGRIGWARAANFEIVYTKMRKAI